MAFNPGETVGPYRIIEQIGRGGMATVYKAYHPALDRYVAIKGMHRAFTEDPNFLARFQREAQVVARLEHPNIVPIYDFSQHEGQPYLVMKYIEGETLKARLFRGALLGDDIFEIIESIGAALTYAHEQGILHRDIKPSNVLLGNDGRIYLADFGLARIAQAGESTMSMDMMLGTPQYISPEQALGKQDLDEGTDIYSFGVMLYELTVGQVPYSADTPFSVVHDHIYTPLPLPRVRNADVPETVERVLLKALAKQRDARFDDVSLLVEAFKQAFQGQDLSGIGPVTRAESTTSPPPLPISGAGLRPEVQLEDASPSPAAAASPTVAAPSLSAARVVRSKPRRKWRWWMAIPIVLVFCFCGLVGLSILRDDSQVKQQETLAAQVDTLLPPLDEPFPQDAPPPGLPPQNAPPPGLPPQDAPPPDEPGPLPEGSIVDQAIQRVEDNPESPFAYLDLAAAYWEVGRYDDAGAIFEKAMDLGGEDVGFLTAAGDFMFERELWLEAAEVYVFASQLNGNQVPLEIKPRLERAIYNAAGDPKISKSDVFTQDLKLRGIDPLLIRIVWARRALSIGDLAETQTAVDQVLQKNPDFPPAMLLQAEIHITAGDKEAAQETLEELVAMGGRGGWVTLQARTFLFELNK